MSDVLRIDTDDDRFARFRLMSWWDQPRLAAARVLVIGAGALGNEILKNLALLGIGQAVVCDLDQIEQSNLSRSVLFREGDRGRAKSVIAAERAREIHPAFQVTPWVGNVVYDLGLGLYRWADVILAGLDNREARVAINRAAARAGKIWIDGAIERLDGVARVFDPACGPCYECTMSANDWKMLAARRSCALLSRGDLAQGKTPTTPTTASIIAGIQCQEAVKWLHGLETLVGRGFVFEGLSHQSYVVSYTRKEDCPSHDPLEPIEVLDWRRGDTSGRQLWERARADLGPGAIVEFQTDLLSGLECPHCAFTTTHFCSLGRVTEREGLCPRCGAPRIPHTYHTLSGVEPFLDQTLEQLGVPAWEVMTARVGTRHIHYELAGDAPDVLGPLAAPPLPTVVKESP
jgi:molybdopterin/thiamine biosynthesis adenylyltransferase